MDNVILFPYSVYTIRSLSWAHVFLGGELLQPEWCLWWDMELSTLWIRWKKLW